MRGKGLNSSSALPLFWITPAHAGKSPAGALMYQDVLDHPRTCGEKNSERDSGAARAGSPPHMRGKGAVLAQRRGLYGITPAHAGKRLSGISRRKIKRDHPRTCGEKPRTFCPHPPGHGSPPHMRGKEV